MKAPLIKLIIAVTGNFGKARSLDKIKQWIEVNGGKYAPKITMEVTHLICSVANYKKPNTVVREARKIRKIKIVTFDWLEDSLHQGSLKREEIYLLKNQIKLKEKEKRLKRSARKENTRVKLTHYVKACNDFKTTMHCDGYHIYRDPSGFLYDINLTRTDLVTNHNERYSIKLYETDVAPKSYASFVVYSSPTSWNCTQILAPIGSEFELAKDAYHNFFELKTKKLWEDRNEMRNVENGSGSASAHAFKYIPPAITEPQGLTNKALFTSAPLLGNLRNNLSGAEVVL